MAEVNNSLLDLDDNPKNQLADPIMPTTSADSLSEVKIIAKTRPTRTFKASAIGKESQKNELAFSLYASINRELRAVDVIFKSCLKGVVLSETFNACVTDIEAKASAITSDYAKLSQLSDNRVEMKIKQHFEFFIGETSKITQRILEQQQSMASEEEETREQEQLEVKERLLEEQRKLEEYLAERNIEEELGSKPKQQQRLGATSTLTTPISLNAQPPLRASLLKSTPYQQSMPLYEEPIRTEPVNLESPPETPTRKTGIWSRLDALSVKEKINQASHAHSEISESDSIRILANEITQGIKRSRKVDIEPEIFSGNALEFDDWECDFDGYLSSMGIEDGSEKIRYLKKYVEGTARECINGQFMIRTELSYRHAREKLTSRFGNKLDVARSMKNKLDTWPKISANDTPALQRYADYLESCSNAMKSIPGLASLDEELNNERFARVLPDWAHQKWGATTHRIRKKEMRYPKFAEFASFVDDLAEMRSQPLMQNLEKAHDKRPRPNNTRSLATNSVDHTPERNAAVKEKTSAPNAEGQGMPHVYIKQKKTGMKSNKMRTTETTIQDTCGPETPRLTNKQLQLT
ncbi:uncharacterized protein [Watersipora subatra]|uniref:uncharacterized protein n=1 Tax=Watersipora subatra TaxID=2589382 RepID=UPI00355B2701